MIKRHGSSVFYESERRMGKNRNPALFLLLTLFFALITASFGRYGFFAMLPLAAYPIYLCVLAGIGAGRMFFRLLPLSFFVFFIGVWNIFFDQAEISVFGLTLSAGWLSFATIMLKFLLASCSVIAMISLTGFDSLCRSLSLLGLPQMLINLLFLFYRYINLITAEARNIIRARLFRGGKISLPQSGNILGPLVLRCFTRSRRIHEALGCRGYRDVIYCEKDTMLSCDFSDKIFGAAWGFFFIALRFNLVSIISNLVLRCVIE